MDLAALCVRVHNCLYVRGDPELAARNVEFLETALERCSAQEDAKDALVYWEAHALLAEVRGDLRAAIRCRCREIQMTERLQRLEGVEEADARSLEPMKLWGGRPSLPGRGADVLESRHVILRELLRQLGPD